MTHLRRHSGLAWLAVWLMAAGTFGYRALTHESASEAVASGTAAVHHAPASKSLKPIEQVEVGDRVAFALNPTDAFDKSLGREVHSAVWRKIELRPDEHSRVVLLRPKWWIDERMNRDANTMAISIPEVGIHADARIVSIEPCPSIPEGEGRVVIGTFSHLAPETIRLTIDGVREPVRCTPDHATWSVEAREFVEAQDLQPGQHVLYDGGIREVLQIEHLPEPIEVYNLEILGQHVYQITTDGMLVHNAGPAGSGLDAVDEVPVGTSLSRNFGGESDLYGRSWSRDPASIQSRDSLGLPDGNTAEFRAHGRVVDSDGISSTRASPLDGNAGGGDEIIVPRPREQIRIDAVTMPDHPL